MADIDSKNKTLSATYGHQFVLKPQFNPARNLFHKADTQTRNMNQNKFVSEQRKTQFLN